MAQFSYYNGLDDYILGDKPLKAAPPPELQEHIDLGQDPGESSMLEDLAAAPIALFDSSDNSGVVGQGRRRIARTLDSLANYVGAYEGPYYSLKQGDYAPARKLTEAERLEIYKAKDGGIPPVKRPEDAVFARIGADAAMLQALEGTDDLTERSDTEKLGDLALTDRAQQVAALGKKADPRELKWAADYLGQRATAQEDALHKAESMRAQLQKGPEDYAQRTMELKARGFSEDAIAGIMQKAGWNRAQVNPAFLDRLDDEISIRRLEGDLPKAMRLQEAKLSLLKQGLGAIDVNLKPGDVLLDQQAKTWGKNASGLEAFAMSGLNAMYSTVRGIHRLAGTLPPGSVDRDILERYSSAAAEDRPVASIAGSLAGGLADPVFLALNVAMAGAPVTQAVKNAFEARALARGVAPEVAKRTAQALTAEGYAVESIANYAIRKWGITNRVVANTLGRLVWNGAAGGVSEALATGLQVAPEQMSPADKALEVMKGAGRGIGLGMIMHGATEAIGKAVSKLKGPYPRGVTNALENANTYLDKGLAGPEVKEDLIRAVDVLDNARQALGTRRLSMEDSRAILADQGIDLDHLAGLKVESADDVRAHIGDLIQRIDDPNTAPDERVVLNRQWERANRILAEAGEPEHNPRLTDFQVGEGIQHPGAEKVAHIASIDGDTLTLDDGTRLTKEEAKAYRQEGAQPSERQAQVTAELRAAVLDAELTDRFHALETQARQEGGLRGDALAEYKDVRDQLHERGLQEPAFPPASQEKGAAARYRVAKWESRKAAMNRARGPSKADTEQASKRQQLQHRPTTPVHKAGELEGYESQVKNLGRRQAERTAQELAAQGVDAVIVDHGADLANRRRWGVAVKSEDAKGVDAATVAAALPADAEATAFPDRMSGEEVIRHVTMKSRDAEAGQLTEAMINAELAHQRANLKLIDHRDEPFVKVQVPIKDLETGTNVLEESAVHEFSTKRAQGAPPILAGPVAKGEPKLTGGKKLLLIEGRHRTAAALKRGETTIEAYVPEHYAKAAGLVDDLTVIPGTGRSMPTEPGSIPPRGARAAGTPAGSLPGGAEPLSPGSAPSGTTATAPPESANGSSPASSSTPSGTPPGTTDHAVAGPSDQPSRSAHGPRLEGVKPPPPAQAPVQGKETTIEVPGRTEPLQARYAVVSAGDAIPSHDARRGFEPNVYGDKNERDYRDPTEGKNLRENVFNMRDRLNPRFLHSDTPTAVDGPPVLDSDLRVLGGNARTMTQQLVYSEGGERADFLRDAVLEDAHRFGISPGELEGVKDPIIVRIAQDTGEPGELSRALNMSFTAARTSDTDAVSRGMKLTEGTVRKVANLLAGERTLSDVFSARGDSDQLLAALVDAGAFDRNDLVGLLDQRGLLTPEGRRTVERTLLGAAIPDIRRMAELPPGLSNTLVRSLPAIVKLRGREDLAFTKTLGDSLDALKDYRDSGARSLEDLISQSSMFPQPWRENPRALGLASAILEDTPTQLQRKLTRVAGGEEGEGLFGKMERESWASVFPPPEAKGGNGQGGLFETAQEFAEANAAYAKGQGSGSPYTPSTARVMGVPAGAVAFRDPLRPVPMPELVRLARAIGVDPVIKKSLRGARGMFRADPTGMAVHLNASIFDDPEAAAKTLAHEIGHLIDFLPDLTMERGNVLGRAISFKPMVSHLGVLRTFLRDTFPLASATNRELRKELLDLTRWWKPYDPALVPASYVQYRESAPELYADALSVLLNSPGLLEQRAPKFYKELLTFMDRKPEVLAAYHGVQDVLGGTPAELADIRRADVREDFAKGSDILRARAEERRQSGQSVVEWVNQALFDTAAPILSRESAARKAGIVRKDSRAAQMAMEDLALRDNAARITLGKIQREVDEPLRELGVSREAAGEFLMMNRIQAGDRAAFANPRGHTVETAEEMLRSLEGEMGPHNWAKFQGVMQRFQDIVHDVAQEAVDEGVYNSKTFYETIVPNRGKYATFAVLDHLDDYIPAAIRQQIGTFKSIANPFDATLMKTVSLHRAIELNRAKRLALVEGLGRWFPGEVVEHRLFPGSPPPKAGTGNDLLPYLVNGKLRYLEVDQYVSKAFQLHDVGLLARIGRGISSATYRVFHPFYVTFSPSFAVSNIQRDIKRTYTNLAAAMKGAGKDAPSFGQVLRAYAEASGPAMARAKGRFDPLVEEMLDQRAFGVPFAKYDPASADAVGYDKLLNEVGLGAEPTRNPLLKLAHAVMNPAEVFSAWTEALPKIAAYKLLTDAGIGGNRRSYIVRNFAGTPNTSRRGLATNLTNGLFMYSNVALQGLRADAELALNPRTAGAFWLRSMLTDFLPKMAMRGAALGLFGAGVKAMFERIPDYDKAAYVIVPLGVTDKDSSGNVKTGYLRLPHNDNQRIIASAAWLLSEGKPLKAIAEVFGQLPTTLSPPLQMAGKWIDYAQGRNPYDSFRNREILSRDAYKAGGWASASQMLRWSLDQFGVASTVMHSFIGEPGNPRELTTTQRIIGSIPGLERVVKFSDRGLTENEWEAVDQEDREKARFKLDLPDAVKSRTSERYRLQRLRGAQEADFKPPDRVRLGQLNAWYTDIYLPLTRAMQAAKDRKDEAGYQRLRAQLDSFTVNVRTPPSGEKP